MSCDKLDEWLIDYRLKNEDTFIAVVRGKRMKNKERLLDEFASAFQFPDYFGENWDALDDCITDFSWLKEKKYVLVIADLNLVLSEIPNKYEIRKIFIDLLKTAKEYWNNPAQLDQWFGHIYVDFDIYIQVDGDLDTDFREILSIN